MQSSNGLVQNGAPSCSNGAAENGHGDGENGFFLNQTNQEIVRLIGQYLKNEGLTNCIFFSVLKIALIFFNEVAHMQVIAVLRDHYFSFSITYLLKPHKNFYF
uniref:Uncharacterized protein LOC114335410 n=1 Tax=Diabrotica virgifera virgifera TaxID=50390 RepID=A0A6P7FXZ2_DIAVI